MLERRSRAANRFEHKLGGCELGTFLENSKNVNPFSLATVAEQAREFRCVKLLAKGVFTCSGDFGFHRSGALGTRTH